MESPVLVQKDIYLKPYEQKIIRRIRKIQQKEAELCGKTSLKDWANGYLYYGLHKTPEGWVYRDKLPNVQQAYLIGDFTNWKMNEDFMLYKQKNGDFVGNFSLDSIKHGDQYRLYIFFDNHYEYRIPAFTKRVIEVNGSGLFNAQVYNPDKKYVFKNKQPKKNTKTALVYEAHIGMSSEEEKISSFDEFRLNVLPKISQLGYDTIQLMAIQEHPYYGSFGYQVSSFFAVSSRFGTPDELRKLIDEAHGLGIRVIMDLVHSHAVKNTVEGIGYYDGTDNLYFHGGKRGLHPAWDTKCFNYGNDLTLHFLLSNCKYWLEEYKFDGFRFDGVTSMLYHNHGLGTDFTDYSMYFDENVDEDAIIYLTFANKLIKQVNKNAITIAEEMSGMPGICETIENNGIGFDFRLAMGNPDFWLKTIKKPDEEWKVGDIFFKLTDKRVEEKVINYVESHDQALVGDKTLIFRLADKYMYDNMYLPKINLEVERAIALHKIIRFITLVSSSNGYLNFMGNEFGHPEWIDFPREGNNWSYQYARRQWSLSENKDLAYYYLNIFDKEMIHFVEEFKVLENSKISDVNYDNKNQILAFVKKNLVFLFNFNPVKSIPDYGLPASKGKYKIVFNSDNSKFLGFNRVDEEIEYHTIKNSITQKYELKVYSVNRSVLVFKKIK